MSDTYYINRPVRIELSHNVEIGKYKIDVTYDGTAISVSRTSGIKVKCDHVTDGEIVFDIFGTDKSSTQEHVKFWMLNYKDLCDIVALLKEKESSYGSK